MSYTTQLLDEFKRAKGIESDYAAAKLLGVTQAAISNYRGGNSHADDRIAIILADELGKDRLQTIARINGDRAKKPEDRAFWRRIASAAAIVLAVYTSMSPGSANAATTGIDLTITRAQYALCIETGCREGTPTAPLVPRPERLPGVDRQNVRTVTAKGLST